MGGSYLTFLTFIETPVVHEVTKNTSDNMSYTQSPPFTVQSVSSEPVFPWREEYSYDEARLEAAALLEETARFLKMENTYAPGPAHEDVIDVILQGLELQALKKEVDGEPFDVICLFDGEIIGANTIHYNYELDQLNKNVEKVSGGDAHWVRGTKTYGVKGSKESFPVSENFIQQ